MKESKFNTQVFDWLNKHGYYSFHVPNGIFADNVINVMQMKRNGMRNGVSDMIVLRPKGRCVFLELKNETGQQSKDQIIFKGVVEELGFEYRVVRPWKNKEKWKELHEWLK